MMNDTEGDEIILKCEEESRSDSEAGLSTSGVSRKRRYISSSSSSDSSSDENTDGENSEEEEECK